MDEIRRVQCVNETLGYIVLPATYMTYLPASDTVLSRKRRAAPTCPGGDTTFFVVDTLTPPFTGSLTSPNYPSNYGNDRQCRWFIVIYFGPWLRIQSTSIVTEAGFDVLRFLSQEDLRASPQFLVGRLHD